MKNIKLLANQFRTAIDMARDAGEFDKDFSFSKFPRGCCGDASDLLAQFLLENSITTDYVCGTYSDGSFEGIWSHAWLLTSRHTIIDITGDQFKYNPVFLNYDNPVYIGVKDDFHKLFVVNDRDIRKTNGLPALGGFCLPRLNELYMNINKYLY